MMNEKFYSVKKTADLLGVSTKTIRRWDEIGRIKTIRSPSNQRRIPESEIKRILGLKSPPTPRCAIYARVSSNKQIQAGNLERQKHRLMAKCEELGFDLVSVISEQASGLNENRKGLKKLFKLAEKHEIDVILIEYKDRLARFGFSYLKELFKNQGIEMIILEEEETTNETEELVKDMLSIVTVFSARLYGRRSKKVKEKVEEIILREGEQNSENEENNKNPNGFGQPQGWRNQHNEKGVSVSNERDIK